MKSRLWHAWHLEELLPLRLAAFSHCKLINQVRASEALEADQLDTITFLVIIATVAVYGLGASPIAKLLGLADKDSNGILIAGADPWVTDLALELKKADLPILVVDSNYAKISAARVKGLEAVCANILNEHVREDLELSGIGQMMAMTQNDEVNALAVKECRHMFGRASLYQLPFNTANTHSRRGLTSNLMGRALFAQDKTFSVIRELYEHGAHFKSTTLSENYTFEDFLENYGDGATLMAVIHENGRLEINTVESPLSPLPGQTVVALVGSVSIPENHAANC